MTISFERSGGFTGVPVRYSANSGDLSESDRNELEQLVNAADFFNLPEHIKAPPGAADVFQFNIALTDNGREHAIEVDQTVVPEKLNPLLKWLTARATRA